MIVTNQSQTTNTKANSLKPNREKISMSVNDSPEYSADINAKNIRSVDYREKIRSTMEGNPRIASFSASV